MNAGNYHNNYSVLTPGEASPPLYYNKYRGWCPHSYTTLERMELQSSLLLLAMFGISVFLTETF